MDSTDLRNLFELYNYKLEDENDKCIVFSYSNPYPAVEIVPLKKMTSEDKKHYKDSYSRAGYAANIREVDNIQSMKTYLFELFFHIEAANDRNIAKYNDYVRKVMAPYQSKRGGVNGLRSYQYINISYRKEEDFEEINADSDIIPSIMSNIKADGAKLIIVEAAAGFGKTSTAYEILKEISNDNTNARPFFMELSKDRSASTFRYLLLSQIEANFDITLKAKVVIQNIKEGRIPLILDGFDELLSRDLDNGEQNVEFKDIESMLSTIAELLENQAKVILTTRKTAIFSGESFYDWYLRHSEKNRFGVCRYQLKEPMAKDWLPSERLKQLGEDTLKSLENPVLLGYLRYIDDKTFETIKGSNTLLENYFVFLLEREEDRQDLPFNVEEQLGIYERLSSYFAGYGISSDTRQTIKEVISMLSEDLINSKVTVNRDFQTLANALTNHALLDRKDNGNIGFINDFIFINLLTMAIKNINDKDTVDFQREIKYPFLDKVIEIGSFWSVEEKRKLYDSLFQKCHLNKILEFWSDVKLVKETSHGFTDISFDGSTIADATIGNAKAQMKNCTFSNISFRSCLFEFNYIYNCTFINCSFDDNCMKIGNNLQNGFYNCKEEIRFIDKDETLDSNEEEYVLSPMDFDKQVLSKYFQVDNRTRRMRMISKLRENYDGKLFKKYFNYLISKKYVKLNGDKSFITDKGVDFYNTIQND